jgi:hypothetical protein
MPLYFFVNIHVPLFKMYFIYLLCVFKSHYLFRVCVWWQWGWVGEGGGFGWAVGELEVDTSGRLIFNHRE